ncbi:MAG: ATP-binding protein [Conexivisphaerales archaeon]
MSLNQAELIKGKVARLAKEGKSEELDFLLVLVANDGYVPKSAFDTCFQSFIEKYGAQTLDVVKRKLIEDEALLTEVQDRLQLNHYNYTQLSQECSWLIFELKMDEYLKKLESITAEPEGEYLLTRLAQNYSPLIPDNVMFQMEHEVGKAHFTRILKELVDAEILFRWGVKDQPSYWRLFQPMRELCSMQSELHKEGLVYVYITQVRHEGVLQSDCAQYKGVILSLRTLGLIKENNWYSHDLYMTTEKGTKLAKSIVQDRILENQTEIERLLTASPKKLMRFLLRELFTSYGYYPAIPRAHPEVVFTEYIRCDIKHDEHRCLLRDPKVRDWRNKILLKLKEMGLCYLAHSYVSTRGGEVRELDYCLPPEITEYFTRYLEKMDNKELFNPEVELEHRAYHFLNSFTSDVDLSRVMYLMQSYLLSKEEGDRILEELVDKGIMKKTNEGYKVKDLPGLNELAEKKFQMIVDYLFEKTVEPETQTSPQPPEPPSKIPEKPPIVQQPTVAGQVSVLLGQKIENGSAVVWQPISELNPHILVVGMSGSGKTETLRTLIYELKKQGIPSLILDFHNEYSSVSDLQIDVRKGITINPLELLGRSPLDVKYEVSSIMRNIYGLGDQQEAYLREAIEQAYNSKGIYEKEEATWGNTPPNFSDVKLFLEERMEENSQSRSVITALLNRLEPVFDVEVFSGGTIVSFDKVVNQSTAVQLRDLPTDEVKTAVSDFFLRRLWYYTYKLGESKNLRFYCVVDEGHRLAYEKSPLDSFLREARKYGVGVMLSSQQPHDFSETIMANVATIVCLRCKLEDDAKFMAKQLGCDPQEIQFMTELGKSIVRFSSSKEAINVQIIPTNRRMKA